MPAAAIGAILFVVAAIMRAENKHPKLRAWLFFGSGATIGVGLLSRIVTKVVHLLYHATDVTTAKVFGTSATLVLLIGLGAWLWFKVIAKGSSGHNAADFFMFLLPVVLTAAGGSWALLSDQAANGTTSLANSVIGFVTDLASGW